jgi:hypothetical protein
MGLSIFLWEGRIEFRIANQFRVRRAKLERSEIAETCSLKQEPESARPL